MAAYLIAEIEVTDSEQYREYTKRTPAAIEKYGGRFLARGGEVLTLEGAQEKGRMVIVEFPSLEKAKEFYNSPEYQEAKTFREGAATGSFILVEGV